MVSISTHGTYKSACCQPAQLDTAAVTLHIISFLQTDTTEDAVTHNTVQEGTEDKSRPQTETEGQEQTETQTDRKAQTTGEGQLLWKYDRRQTGFMTLQCTHLLMR